MLELLFNRRTLGKIGSITLDAVLNESHEYSNTVTQYPVETGSDINDHIRNEPEQVTITGHVTNSPVKLLGLVSITEGIDRSGVEDRVQAAFETLMRYAGVKYPSANESVILKQGNGTPTQKTVLTSTQTTTPLLDIVTGLRVYSDMAITKLTVPRDNKTGQAMQFTISLVKVRRVTSSSITMPAVRKDVPKTPTQATNKTNVGKQPTKPTSSLFAQAYHNALNFAVVK